MYRFEVGQRVLVTAAGSGSPLAIRRIEAAKAADSFVELNDGSHWYHTGLPVYGPARYRLTPITPVLNAQLNRQTAVARVSEATQILSELVAGYSTLTNDDLKRVEGALLSAIRLHGDALRTPVARRNFLGAVSSRLNTAERTVLDGLMYEPPLASGLK